MRSNGLIGHTGFVGGNLLRAHPFGACFNSASIASARGRHFGLLVCAGARAEKWIANRDEAADKAGIDALMAVLNTVTADRAVLISTTDVYADTRGRTEAHAADIEGNQPYGRNRALLEKDFRERFPEALIVRLPGLFGPGLKKNVIHDLIKDHEVQKIDPAGMHQYYPVTRLWDDLGTALRAGIRTLNITSPPMRVSEICLRIFGVVLDRPGTSAVDYDMHSIHAGLFGGQGPYLYPAEAILAELERFVSTHPDRKPLKLPPWP